MKKPPSKVTLRKYGLTEADYFNFLDAQDYKCPICGNELSKTTNIDHFHVKGWLKMPPELRKQYVRGVVDWFCNKNYLARGITIERSKNVTSYLERFERRKPK
jgi:hypothetical protein